MCILQTLQSHTDYFIVFFYMSSTVMVELFFRIFSLPRFLSFSMNFLACEWRTNSMFLFFTLISWYACNYSYMCSCVRCYNTISLIHREQMILNGLNVVWVFVVLHRILSRAKWKVHHFLSVFFLFSQQQIKPNNFHIQTIYQVRLICRNAGLISNSNGWIHTHTVFMCRNLLSRCKNLI